MAGDRNLFKESRFFNALPTSHNFSYSFLGKNYHIYNKQFLKSHKNIEFSI